MPTTFTPNCTLTPDGTNFVSSPPVRGTLNILWSCLSIFVLCTWSVYRPNVPSQAEPENKKQMFRKELYLFKRQMMFTLRMLFIPEMEMASASLQLSSALETSKYAKSTNEDPWTLADSFLLDMGGIAVHFPKQIMSTSTRPNTMLRDVSTNGNTTGRPRDRNSGTSQGSATSFESDWQKLSRRLDMEEESMGKTPLQISRIDQPIIKAAVNDFIKLQIKPYRKWLHAGFFFQYDFWILNGRQNCYAKYAGIIKRMPRLSMGALAAQNRGSILVKALALLQVLWLIMQILVRAQKHLPSAQLEILTLAYAILAFFIYLLLWEKPQEVMTVTTVNACKAITIENIENLMERAPDDFGPSRNTPWMSTTAINPTRASTNNGIGYLIASVGSLIFGAVHLAAWNFAFPTTAERWLWRICSLITAALPLLFLIGYALLEYLEEKLSGSWFVLIHPIFLVVSSAIYVAARLFIMVEAFRSLGFLSTETFQSTWAANVPHVG